eukprot:10199439-Alexandrium_andersonii.AAC.1
MPAHGWLTRTVSVVAGGCPRSRTASWSLASHRFWIALRIVYAGAVDRFAPAFAGAAASGPSAAVCAPP